MNKPLSSKNITFSPSELAVMMRQDLYAFIHACFNELNPQTPFSDNWHIELLAAKLESCRRGECRRLIINVPPRSLKSLAATVAFPAWLLGHNPSAQIITASYGQDLSDKLALDCCRVMQSSRYQALFPTRLAANKQSVADFMTTEGGCRMATSVGGVLTGRGADFIIIDDPLKPDEAVSETQRRNTNDWFDHTLYSRLNSKATGCIIIIMQRLHMDDLVGHVLEQEDWEVLSLPAIAEEDHTFQFQTPYGERSHTRLAGEALHPERENLETLEQIRRTTGDYNFSAQYQQSPVPMGGGMVKQVWFVAYELHQLPEKFTTVVQSWDTACKESELSDYSVCTTWGVKDNRIFLLHVMRKRMDYPTLKRQVRELGTQFKASTILIEDKSSGTQLIQELKSEGLHTVKGIKPEGDKVMRLHAQTATIENGFVYLPKEAPWLTDYVTEMTSFPKGKHDDQVDSTSQALEWIKSGMWGKGMGCFYYYKEQYEKMHGIC